MNSMLNRQGEVPIPGWVGLGAGGVEGGGVDEVIPNLHKRNTIWLVDVANSVKTRFTPNTSPEVSHSMSTIR